MGGLMRAFKCASWRAGRFVGMTLLFAVGFTFYFMLLDGTSFTLVNIVSRFPQMIMFVGSFMYLAFGMVDTVTYLQYAMSCGCTRKNTLISTVYMHAFELAVTELVLLLYFLAVPAGWVMLDRKEAAVVMLALFIFDMGLSMVMGILVKRFGKIAYIIVILICAFGGGMIGGMVGFFGYGILADMVPHVSLVLPLAALVWYGFMAFIFWLSIRKMEVRV